MAQDDGSLTFGALNARNQQLRGLLAGTILALDAKPEAEPARQLVRTALRENLDRALAPPED